MGVTEQKRLKILSEDELEAIYSRPHFTNEERSNYFSLSQPEKELLQTLRSIKSQVYFVLQLEYFKAKHQFFTFDLHEVMEDLQYVLEQHFDNSKIADLNQINRFTRLKQQYLILELFDYCDCDAKERQKIMLRAHKTVAVCSKPVYIFREIIHYLYEQRIVAPGYSSMQKMVSEALTYEQNRLTAIMQDHLKQSDIEALNRSF